MAFLPANAANNTQVIYPTVDPSGSGLPVRALVATMTALIVELRVANNLANSQGLNLDVMRSDELNSVTPPGVL